MNPSENALFNNYNIDENIIQLINKTPVEIKGLLSPKTKEENKKLLYNLYTLTNFLPENASITQRLWHVKNNTKVPPQCKMCNNTTKWSIKQKRYTLYCCNACRAKDPEVENKRKNTCIERYGIDKSFSQQQHLQQTRKTCKQRYGVEYPLQNTHIYKKTENTLFKHFGNSARKTLNKLSLSSLNKKYNITTEEKTFGSLFSEPKFRKKAVFTLKNNNLPSRLKSIEHLVIPLFKIEEYQNCHQILPWKCVKCGNQFKDSLQDGKIPRCKICFPLNRTNWHQQEIYQFLCTLVPDVQQNNRDIIKPKQLDFYIPSQRLAIEYNGLYWHSTLNSRSSIDWSKYHLEKTIACKNQNITLIHIFEDEWFKKQPIVKSIIASKITNNNQVIYARKCTIKQVDSKLARSFLEENHLQGYNHAKLIYGLFFEDDLVQIISFGKSRFQKNNSWEIYRLCSKLNVSVVGGTERLFNHFVKENNPQCVISYSDNRYFTGNTYKRLGFENVGYTAPSYFYVSEKDGCTTRYNRMKFQKHKLKTILEKYDHCLSEDENMKNNGYGKIWDCGTTKWVWKTKK